MQVPQDLVNTRPHSFSVRTKPKDDPVMTQAKALETSFLSEMLGYAGVGKTQESFGGGIGEDQFASFLRDEEAKQIVAHGGIGLAEHLFQAMTRGQENAG